MIEVRTEFCGKPRTDFMIGIEVEHTSAYGMKTLFVQGFKTFNEIQEKTVGQYILHIYLGANRSFELDNDWSLLISKLLNSGFRVTLDYPVEYHNKIQLTERIKESAYFIPMVTVDIPNLTKFSENLIIKVDDPTAVNPGVWCMTNKDIASTGKFTAWAEYADDIIIEETK